jgi:hypothetical protein
MESILFGAIHWSVREFLQICCPESADNRAKLLDEAEEGNPTGNGRRPILKPSREHKITRESELARARPCLRIHLNVQGAAIFRDSQRERFMENVALLQRQLPSSSGTDMATAFWANSCLLSLQAAHRMALACMTPTASSWAGTLKATGSYYEQDQSR